LKFQNKNVTLKAFRAAKLRDTFFIFRDDFESAWRLHDIDHHCPIILVSDSGEYALISYRIQVAHYLTKPISKEKINEALRRIKKTGGIFYEQN